MSKIILVQFRFITTVASNEKAKIGSWYEREISQVPRLSLDFFHSEFVCESQISKRKQNLSSLGSLDFSGTIVTSEVWAYNWFLFISVFFSVACLHHISQVFLPYFSQYHVYTKFIIPEQCLKYKDNTFLLTFFTFSQYRGIYYVLSFFVCIINSYFGLKKKN